MKIQLPLENWSDLLPFVPRLQLVPLLFQVGDRQFASILQYCLNEVGQITLPHPLIYPQSSSYFDFSVLDFLQKFHEHKNALLANVNLSIPFLLPMEKVHPILAQILPLFGDNINSLQLVNHDLLAYSRLLNNIQCSGNNEGFSELMTKILAQTRILSIKDGFCLAFDWYCRWLYAPRMNGQPRMLHISLTKEEALDFFDLIKKDFLMAKHPATFFIRMQTSLALEFVCLENGVRKCIPPSYLQLGKAM